MRDTTFLIFKTHFLYKIPLLLPWWSKDVLVVLVAGSQLRNPPVKFRHERWLHLAIDQRSIQHVQIEAGLNSDPGNDSFSVEICDAKHVDQSILTRRCRSTQVKLYTVWSHQLTPDLKRCLLFRKYLRSSSLKESVWKQFRCLRLS